MDYIEKLGLHYCDCCGTVSNLCWWDGTAVLDGVEYKLEGIAQIDDRSQTFDLEPLITKLVEDNNYNDYDEFDGEPNCPYCKSQSYWPINECDLKAIKNKE